MRERTWHICQAAHGMAKGRSRASLGPPRDPDFLRAMYGPSIATETPQPSTRRRPQLIVVARDSIPSTGPPRAVVRCRSRPTPYRAKTPSPHAAVHCRSRATLRARRKVVREDDRERSRRKKIAAGSTLANCQFNYAKPLEMNYF